MTHMGWCALKPINQSINDLDSMLCLNTFKSFGGGLMWTGSVWQPKLTLTSGMSCPFWYIWHAPSSFRSLIENLIIFPQQCNFCKNRSLYQVFYSTLSWSFYKPLEKFSLWSRKQCLFQCPLGFTTISPQNWHLTLFLLAASGILFNLAF